MLLLLLFIFVPSLSSCHAKVTVALYFGRIRTRLGVAIFEFSDCFFDFYHLIYCLFEATKQR